MVIVETEMAILYVASEAAELKPMAGLLTGLRKLKWPIDYAFEGILDGRRVLLAANGAGPKLAAHAVEMAVRAVADLSSSRLEAVVSTGYCGALDPALEHSQIVVASHVTDVESKQVFECLPATSTAAHVTGPIASQDRIAIDAGEKRRLRAQTGALAVEMEAVGVAARAKRAGLPFCCIKVISDRADESFDLDLNGMRTTEGRLERGKIMFQAVSRPNILPGLFRLKRRSESAARALGEFLVSCRISSDVNIISAD